MTKLRGTGFGEGPLGYLRSLSVLPLPTFKMHPIICHNWPGPGADSKVRRKRKNRLVGRRAARGSRGGSGGGWLGI